MMRLSCAKIAGWRTVLTGSSPPQRRTGPVPRSVGCKCSESHALKFQQPLLQELLQLTLNASSGNQGQLLICEANDPKSCRYI